MFSESCYAVIFTLTGRHDGNFVSSNFSKKRSEEAVPESNYNADAKLRNNNGVWSLLRSVYYKGGVTGQPKRRNGATRTSICAAHLQACAAQEKLFLLDAVRVSR